MATPRRTGIHDLIFSGSLMNDYRGV